jgi:hypothetical protein
LAARLNSLKTHAISLAGVTTPSIPLACNKRPSADKGRTIGEEDGREDKEEERKPETERSIARRRGETQLMVATSSTICWRSRVRKRRGVPAGVVAVVVEEGEEEERSRSRQKRSSPGVTFPRAWMLLGMVEREERDIRGRAPSGSWPS